MVSIVDDFKDIASRMKGELKPEDRLKPYCDNVLNSICPDCDGSGQDKTTHWISRCSYCNGTGSV